MKNMTPNFHFISGLPRSGSTLLSAILRQNPDFYAGMSSGLGLLVPNLMQKMSPGSEVSLMVSDNQRKDILKGIFSNYYHSVTERPVIFDTNRLWTLRMPMLDQFFPEAKIIACVRDVSWVLDSIERQAVKNPFHFSQMFGVGNSGSVYGRTEFLMGKDSMVGSAWSALKESFYGDFSKKILIIDYDVLTSAPEKAIRLVYQFLEIDYFEGHDFNHIEFDAESFDSALGLPGLHKVRPKVEKNIRRTILPPDVFAKYQGMDFWKDLSGSVASVIGASVTTHKN